MILAQVICSNLGQNAADLAETNRLIDAGTAFPHHL